MACQARALRGGGSACTSLSPFVVQRRLLTGDGAHGDCYVGRAGLAPIVRPPRRAAGRSAGHGDEPPDVTSQPRTSLPFGEALSELLTEKGLSANRLAQQIGVSQPFLSRVMRGADYKTPSPGLMSAVSDFFGLPHDYWREAREAFVFEHLRRHPDELDRIYDRLRTTGE